MVGFVEGDVAVAAAAVAAEFAAVVVLPLDPTVVVALVKSPR